MYNSIGLEFDFLAGCMFMAKCPKYGKDIAQGVCLYPALASDNELKWEFICHLCKAHFDVPVPRGPTEEKQIKCPKCGSQNIERIDVHKFEVCPPGG